MKKIFDVYRDKTELDAETKNAMTELYDGITNCVRDVSEKEIIIFSGNRTE